MGAVIELHSASPAVTERYGAALGSALRAGDLLVLEGTLGAGKTCLVRGIVDGAGGDAATVRSPTFVLHQPHRGSTITVHHIDLYRLGASAAVDFLDLDTLLRDGAAVIEWGGYADLSAHGTTTLAIEGGESATDRVLRMRRGGAAHLEEAWQALLGSTPTP